MTATTTSAACELLASLVLESGARWGEVAVDEQWSDARAVLDPDGVPFHFLTRSRGFSKTADLGGMTIAVLLTQLPPGSRCYGLAADRDQGRLLVDSVLGFITRTPELAGALDVDAYKITARRSGSTFEVLAADAASAWGLRPALAVIDEVSAWSETPGPRRLFDAMTSALGKVEGARAVVICSAGDPAHWSYKVLEHARVDPLWRTHEVDGPAPWMPADRLEEQRRRLLPSMFARLFENRWLAAEDRLTSIDDVRACVEPGSGALDPVAGVAYVVGLDVGIRNDRTVAAVCSLGASDDGSPRVVLDRMAVWAPSHEDELNFAEVEEWLIETSRAYNRAEVVYDPYAAVQLAQRMRSANVRAREFTFSTSNISRLAVTLYRLLREHRLDLPDDAALIDELANVRLRETGPGHVRIDHDPSRHDDRVIALALGAYHLLDAPAPRRLRFRH